jgi:hypothetical protein
MIQAGNFPGHHTFDPCAKFALAHLSMEILVTTVLIEPSQFGDKAHLNPKWKAT